MQIVGQHRWLAVSAQVLRCHISALGKQATYRGAIEFGRRLELEQLLRSGGHDPAELHRLQVLASGSVDVDQPSDSAGNGQRDPWTLQVAGRLKAVRTMIESVANRRGLDRARPMEVLLRDATPLFERGVTRQVVVASMLDFVRKLMPEASIRLLDADELAVVSHGDAFYVDVPRASDRPAGRLLVEFLRAGRLETGQLELLRLTAHLVALAADVHREERLQPQAGSIGQATG